MGTVLLSSSARFSLLVAWLARCGRAGGQTLTKICTQLGRGKTLHKPFRGEQAHLSATSWSAQSSSTLPSGSKPGRLIRPSGTRPPVGRLPFSFTARSPAGLAVVANEGEDSSRSPSIDSGTEKSVRGFGLFLAANSAAIDHRHPSDSSRQPGRRPSRRHPASAAPTRLRIVRESETHSDGAAGRMVISGRMADVCAELDRLAQRES